MKGCVILLTLSEVLPVCPAGKRPPFDRGQPSNSLLGPVMCKNLIKGPAKSTEVSLEGNFKDSITRKRWLGRQTKCMLSSYIPYNTCLFHTRSKSFFCSKVSRKLANVVLHSPRPKFRRGWEAFLGHWSFCFCLRFLTCFIAKKVRA